MSQPIACTLFSSSKGNCTYVKNGGEEFLIDAGVSLRSLECALSALGTSPKNLRCIFITHEHSDHIKGVMNAMKKYGLTVYAPYMSRRVMINSDPAAEDIIPFDEGLPADICLTETGVTPFRTPHDAMGSVCYRFDFGSTALGYATDIGHVSRNVETCLIGCESVVIESNYDIDMLKNGSYPAHLKKRIAGSHGHLSNSDCAAFAPRLINSGASSIVLAHLSEENNLPSIAFAETSGSLAANGIEICRDDRPGDVSLAVAPKAGICRIL